jgi:hypothetical protein
MIPPATATGSGGTGTAALLRLAGVVGKRAAGLASNERRAPPPPLPGALQVLARAVPSRAVGIWHNRPRPPPPPVTAGAGRIGGG